MDGKSLCKKLVGSEDERAVSPVVGVILMVAVTVILAAVIAAFVLEVGDLDEDPPNTQFDWDTVDGDSGTDAVNVTFTHETGDNIDASNIRVTVDDGTTSDDATLNGEFEAGDTIEFGPADDSEDQLIISGDIDDKVEIDEVDEVDDGDDASEEIEEITVTWEGDDTSTIIAEHEP